MDRVLAEYQNCFGLNGPLIKIYSLKTRWSGGKKQTPGIWLKIKVSYDQRILCEFEREISNEFPEYAELKHRQIVNAVRRGDDLERITVALDKIFSQKR